MKIQKCLSAARLFTTKSSKPRRKITGYSHSIARMRDDDHALCKTHSVMQNLRSIVVRDMVSDHSYRRVQLFYLTAVAYHNENCEVALDRTISQIGKSSCQHCNAAHHAILPRLKDNFFPLLRDRLKANPNDTAVIQKIKNLGLSIEVISELKTAHDIDQFFHKLMESHRDRLIHKDSHLQRCLDSTLIMPKQINEYDCIIEDRMRPVAVKLIQQVSHGLDPYEATGQFVQLMTDFYARSFVSTQKVITLLQERNLLVRVAAAAGQNAIINAQLNKIKNEIRKEPYVRNVLKKANGVQILEADLEIIAQQLASTIKPPREFLDLGRSLDELKDAMLKV